MRPPTQLRLLSIAAGITAISFAVRADFTMHYLDATVNEGRESIHISSVGTVFRGPQSHVLYRARDDALVFVDSQTKSYTLMDEVRANAVRDQLLVRQAQIGTMAAKILQSDASGEQHAKAQELLRRHGLDVTGKPQPAQRFQIIKKGASEVGGIACQNTTVTKGGQPFQEVCVADPQALGVSQADYEMMVRATNTLQRRVSRLSPQTLNDESMDMRILGGIPISFRSLTGKDNKQLTSHSPEPIDRSVFAVPSDYAQR